MGNVSVTRTITKQSPQSVATPFPAVLSDSGMFDAGMIETKYLAGRRGILNVF